MHHSTSTFILILGAALLGSTAAAQRLPSSPAGKRKAHRSSSAIVDQLRQQYKISRLAQDANGAPQVLFGTPLLVQKGGIIGVPWNTIGVAVATYEKGVLHQPGTMSRMFAGNDTLPFQPGDRVYFSEFNVNVKSDKVTFTVVTADYVYKAGVHFKFPKGYLSVAEIGQIQDVIAQVLAYDTSGDAVSQDQGQPAGQPQPQPGQSQPAQPPVTADGRPFEPIIVNGQLIGYMPPGIGMMPPNQQPQPIYGQPFLPLYAGGQLVGYAPPGSVLFTQNLSPPPPAPMPPAAAVTPAPPPVRLEPQVIRLGQTGEEVQAILGTPDKIANLGAKVIFIYKDLKVTMVDGRVTDVQ